MAENASGKQHQAHVPVENDVAVPSVARIYDYLLGGKDNYAADRKAAQQLIDISPNAAVGIRENRAFLQRAVRYAAQAGVRQFIDIGSGLPTQGNVHEIARTIAPGSRVVYVDNDPVVAVHGRALLLDDTGNTAFVQADLRQAKRILHEPAVTKLIDFGRPVAILLAAVLHFVSDAEDPRAHLADLREATAPGSLLVLSHGTADPFPEKGERAAQVYQAATAGLSLRSQPDILRFFEGYDLVEPGLVYAPTWHPEAPPTLSDPRSSGLLVGIGRRR
ncbi:SAM-dependent methyltransferase [Actinomadura scrupuli]|uniref:SAM-dependent methyltransferase n=1 Tax=Actinomadura scrupuli TaxID=559629 RepID=UPI003D97D8B8